MESRCTSATSKLFPKAGTAMQRISTARQCLLSTLYKSHLGINGVPQSWASSLKGSCRPQFCRSFAPYSLSCCWTFSGDSILPLFHHRDSVWVSKQLQGLSAHFLAASPYVLWESHKEQWGVRPIRLLHKCTNKSTKQFLVWSHSSSFNTSSKNV